MKNIIKVLGNLKRARRAKVPLLIVALVAVIGFTVIACDNGTTSKSGGGSKTPSDPTSVTYTSYDGDGNEYELVIKDKSRAAAYSPKNGDTYTLTVKNLAGTTIAISTGTITVGGSFTLTPESGAPITIVISDGAIGTITGTIPGAGSNSPITNPAVTKNKPIITLKWTEVRPFGVPDNPDDDNIFWSVAYGGGKFFATRNNDARLVSSANGITWTEVTPSPITGGRGVVAYGNGTFVAGRGDTSYSADGVTWTRLEENATGGPWVNCIVYGGGKFVAGADWSSIAYSTDGVTWTRSETTVDVTRAIAYGGGKFVAVGHGQNWDNGNWLDDGKMAYSTDGVTWTGIEQSIFSETRIVDIAYGNGRFVAVAADGKMGYSADGVNWTTIGQNIFGNHQNIMGEDDSINGIAYGGGKFVVVGGGSGKMAYSTDSITWTEAEDIPTSNRGVFGIAYGGGRFVIALGEDKIAYSNLQE